MIWYNNAQVTRDGYFKLQMNVGFYIEISKIFLRTVTDQGVDDLISCRAFYRIYSVELFLFFWR